MSKIVDIINQFIIDNGLVDARICEEDEDFRGMHSRLTVGGAHEVVEQIEELMKEATVNGLIMAKYGTDEGSKEERFIDILIKQEQE